MIPRAGRILLSLYYDTSKSRIFINVFKCTQLLLDKPAGIPAFSLSPSKWLFRMLRDAQSKRWVGNSYESWTQTSQCSFVLTIKYSHLWKHLENLGPKVISNFLWFPDVSMRVEMLTNNKSVKKLKSEQLQQVSGEFQVNESFKFIVPENKIALTSISVSVKVLTPAEDKSKSSYLHPVYYLHISDTCGSPNKY